MRKVEFTKKFSNKKKGDEFTCSNSLANMLVRTEKVAKYIETPKA